MVKPAIVSSSTTIETHGSLCSPGITHSEITQIAFVRSLARYLLETKAIDKYDVKNKEYTIDQLYRMTYPKWSVEKLHIHSYPLKSILDTILAENALVDMDRNTKKLPAAHFDSEAFRNGSRRMIKIRRISNSSFFFDLPVSKLDSLSLSLVSYW